MVLRKRYQNNHKPFIHLNEIQLGAKKAFQEKIQQGIYSYEHIHCPVCNTEDVELISEKDRYGLDYRCGICKNCGLVYVNPRINQEAYNQFYDNYYRKLYRGSELPSDEFFSNQLRRGEKIVSYISSKIDLKLDGLKVLEIGCGAGGILKYFELNGSIVKGIDLGSEYLNFGKDNYGLDLMVGSLFDLNDEFKPDLIIYSHVLEHVLDLNSELTQLKKLCTEETYLYIEVPGIKSVHAYYQNDLLKYFQNAHVYNFSLTTLTNLMHKNGFSLLTGDEYVHSIFKMQKSSPLKKNLIESDYKEVQDYLHWLEKKRLGIGNQIVSLKKKIFPKAIIKKSNHFSL